MGEVLEAAIWAPVAVGGEQWRRDLGFSGETKGKSGYILCKFNPKDHKNNGHGVDLR
jgi:hypothetical protein